MPTWQTFMKIFFISIFCKSHWSRGRAMKAPDLPGFQCANRPPLLAQLKRHLKTFYRSVHGLDLAAPAAASKNLHSWRRSEYAKWLIQSLLDDLDKAVSCNLLVIFLFSHANMRGYS